MTLNSRKFTNLTERKLSLPYVGDEFHKKRLLLIINICLKCESVQKHNKFALDVCIYNIQNFKKN